MKSYICYTLIAITFFFFQSCEEEFIPEISSDPTDIVVEGYIEAGEDALPPYVLLTRSQPFFSEINVGNLDEFYVHDAIVSVSDGDKTTILSELCWNDFTPEEQELLAGILGNFGVNNLDSIPGNFCVYLDPDFNISGEVGKSYDLRIEVEGKVLTSTTTIPNHVPLDSIYFLKPAGNVPDRYLEMRAFITDPVNELNFYRYFTAVNNGALRSPIQSVADDAFFDGQEFEFPLSKAEAFTKEFSDADYGLYTRGDTVTIKWTTIDKAHFDFWNTLEFNRFNQGPFANYTLVDHNIEGGIGIWGGYSSSYYKLTAED